MSSINWISFPLKDEPILKTCLLMVSIFIFVVMSTITFGISLGILSFFLLFISLLKYFLPIQYFINSNGIIATGLFFSIKKSWSEIIRYSLRDNGIFVSPYLTPTRVDSFRGLFIRFNKNIKREKVIKIFSHYKGKKFELETS